MDTILSVKDITKKYKGNDYNSLENVSLDIKSGECVAFLGPNGSGKSTLMRILCGMLPVSDGNILYMGKEIKTAKLKDHIGYLPESNNLPEFLRVYDFFHMMGRLYMLPKEVRKARWREYDKFLELGTKRKIIRKLSQGSRRKLLIVQTLLNRPDVLILDEPTVYLDLLTKHNFYNHLQELKRQGTTIIISSHVLSEIEKLADRIFIFREGVIKEELDMNDLLLKKEWEYDVIKKIT